MDNTMIDYENYTSDQWIDHFKEKISETNDIDKVKKYEKAIRLITNITASQKTIFTEDMYIKIKLISDAMRSIFSSWEYFMIKTENSIVLYNDILYIELYDDKGTYCFVGFGHTAEPNIVFEVSLVLNAIFNGRLDVSPHVFYNNKLNDEFIWGIEKIKNFFRKLSGHKKLHPVIVFDDDQGGTC